ncbi:hypothetical protein GLOIN_2v1597659, partial [Rhizophagus irregularis DAOM 181602=DAOM 197198]
MKFIYIHYIYRNLCYILHNQVRILISVDSLSLELRPVDIGINRINRIKTIKFLNYLVNIWFVLPAF